MSQEEMDNLAEITEDVSIDDMAADFGEMSDDSEGTPAKEQTKDESTVKATGEATFEVDGEQVTMAQLIEWKHNGMMQADYTRGKQELAEARRELEAEAQERWINDFYSSSDQPKGVVENAKDISSGDLDVSDEDMSLLDPVTRKIYETAQKNRKMLEAYENERAERKRADGARYVTNTFDNFVAKIEKETGMSNEEAGELAADISAKTRKLVSQGKVAYCPEALDMVYKASLDVETLKRQSAEKGRSEYLAEKEKDAEAALAGASSYGAELPPIDPVEMDFENPEELIERMAQDLGTFEGF